MPLAILFDAMNLVHRCHYAADPDYDPIQGPPVGFLHGVLGSLSRIRRENPDAAMVLCWDGPGISWRKSIYPEYKAKRKYRDGKEELYAAIPELRDLLADVLGYRSLCLPQLEGDDVIGILSWQLSQLDYDVRIYSTDEDYYQLITNRISVVRPRMKGDELISLTSFCNQFKFSPARWKHVVALAGDVGDNIPGIHGVGPKTAALYVRYYANSEKDWSEQVDVFRNAFPALEPLWDTDTRRMSARLTRIPRLVSELRPYFGAAALPGIHGAIRQVADDPYRLPMNAVTYRQWRDFIAAHPFHSSMSYGNELVRGK